MNRFFAVIALTALIASPALAKSANANKAQSALCSYAQSQQYRQPQINVITDDGRVIGADPDLQIRSTILRDHYTW